MSNFPLFFINKQKKEYVRKPQIIPSIDTSSLGKIQCTSMNSLSNFMSIICKDINTRNQQSPLNVSHKKLYLNNKNTSTNSIKDKISDLYKEIYSTEPNEKNEHKMSNLESLRCLRIQKKKEPPRCCLTTSSLRENKINGLLKMLNSSSDITYNTCTSSSNTKRTKESDDIIEDNSIFNI